MPQKSWWNERANADIPRRAKDNPETSYTLFRPARASAVERSIWKEQGRVGKASARVYLQKIADTIIAH
jgi:hypothetical protein